METKHEEIAEVVKDGTVGAIQGTGEVINAAVSTVGNTAGATVKKAAELLGDVGLAAKGAVEGAINGAKEIGLTIEEAASAAATGAVKAAYEISSEIGTKVQAAVTGTISGVKVVIKEPFKSEKK